MRNMLAFLAAVVVTVAAVGWYLDWYKIGTVPGSSGHQNVVVDINAVKIGHDIHKASEKGEKWVAEHNNKSATTSASTVSVKGGRHATTATSVTPATPAQPVTVEGPNLLDQR